jgi:DNA-binding response OmpR family regulator
MTKNKILIIDDEESAIALIGSKLSEAGYEVSSANDGFAGLEQARKSKPDLIILDIMLPGLGGYKVCQMLKFDENYKAIPIILLSARNNEEDRKMGLQTGANLYLTKNTTKSFWDNLVSNIDTLIKNK